MEVKLIYGTDTGNTERIVGDLEIKLKASSIDYETVPVTGIPKEHWESHKNYILGIPTWYDGELQSCWEDYFDTFKELLDSKAGFLACHWDGSSQTEDKIKELTKATIRCIPLDLVEEKNSFFYHQFLA